MGAMGAPGAGFDFLLMANGRLIPIPARAIHSPSQQRTHCGDFVVTAGNPHANTVVSPQY
jgi:hypothetical protein